MKLIPSKKLSAAFLLFSSLALLGNASSAWDQQDELSLPKTNKKNVKFVLQVASPGASTPVANFYRAKNVQDEPKIDNYLTPLGQRQQFLIGTELRQRYHYEAVDFLPKSFDINQMYVQSTFDQKSILSAQAQLLGLFPPHTNGNILNEWQQSNAIPPLTEELMEIWSPYFKEWEVELKEKALFDGFTVFPINMVAHADDLMLRLDQANCPSWRTEVEKNYEKLVPSLKYFEENLYPELAQKFGYSAVFLPQALEMCQYIQWADLHNVELDFSVSEQNLKDCNDLDQTYVRYLQQVDSDNNYLASSEFVQYLRDHLQTFNGSKHYKKSLHFKKKVQPLLERAVKAGILGEPATPAPTYVFLLTEPTNIKLFLNALVPKALQHEFQSQSSPNLAASTLIFEVSQSETTGKNYITALFNDEIFPLPGCEITSQQCELENFLTYLNENSNLFTSDVVKACSQEASVTSQEIIQ